MFKAWRRWKLTYHDVDHGETKYFADTKELVEESIDPANTARVWSALDLKEFLVKGRPK